VVQEMQVAKLARKKYIRCISFIARNMNHKQAFFLQPMVAISKKLTEEEKPKADHMKIFKDPYLNLVKEMLELRKEGIPIFSLLDVFQNVEERIYADWVHCYSEGPERESKGYQLLAEWISSILENEWKLKRKRN
jgi:hypothetical protein